MKSISNPDNEILNSYSLILKFIIFNFKVLE